MLQPLAHVLNTTARASQIAIRGNETMLLTDGEHEGCRAEPAEVDVQPFAYMIDGCERITEVAWGNGADRYVRN
jgi:hypothetical protein